MDSCIQNVFKHWLCGKPGIHKHIISFYSGSERIPDKLDGSIRFMHHTWFTELIAVCPVVNAIWNFIISGIRCFFMSIHEFIQLFCLKIKCLHQIYWWESWVIYLNCEAKKGLWEYIHAHDSMIDAVHGYTYFSEPIAFEMDDGDIKETIRPYAMGRIEGKQEAVDRLDDVLYHKIPYISDYI